MIWYVGLGWELNLEVLGVWRPVKRAEWVSRENPEIKQRILSATGK
jgi:hypothetical protein